jgi:hypothetical protein
MEDHSEAFIPKAQIVKGWSSDLTRFLISFPFVEEQTVDK